MQREEDALNDTDQKPRRLKQREPGREPNETCLISTEGWTRRVHFVREGGGGTSSAPPAPGAPRAGRTHPLRRASTACCSAPLATRQKLRARGGGQPDRAQHDFPVN